RATGELSGLQEAAAPELRKAMADPPSAEARQRLEQILQRLEGVPTADRIRDMRAGGAPEDLRHDEARRVLGHAAEGPAGGPRAPEPARGRRPVAVTFTRSAAPRWGRGATPSTPGRSRRTRRPRRTPRRKSGSPPAR